MERAKRAADAIIAALSVQSERGAKRASGSAARSSEFGGDAADDRDRPVPGLSGGSVETADEGADDRALIRRREIRPSRRELGLGEVAHRVEQRRLEPREGQIVARNARDGERERLGVALARETVDLRPARVAEPEQPGALVERLAGGVVERRAEHVVSRPVTHRQDQRVAAAREQAREGRLERVGCEIERGDVAPEMVDRDERDAARPCEGLCGREPDEQRADEARALRDADAPDVAELRRRVLECRADHRRDELEVPPRCDLRDDPAVPRVEVGLRRDDRRQHDAAVVDDGGGRLVAGRFDAEDELAHAPPTRNLRRRHPRRAT